MEVLSDLRVDNNELIEIVFSNDNNYIVIASRNYGFASVNIKDPKNPIMEAFLRTKGGFSVISSLNG